MDLKHLKKPELLLPVGTKEMAMAAIHNGADAIFMGVPGFNARGRSYDFQIEEVKEIIDLCHTYGVKVNLAFNILVFQNEIGRAIEVLEKIIPLKPDAFIVQDLGLVRLIRQMAPAQRIHASTQMSVTNAEAIHWLDDLGIQRFVLARENSLPEIQAIKKNTDKEIEVFVHGALCVSYSGQCFTSEGIGGRSANRGQCAQSCRFSYEMYVDGEKKDLHGKSFLVSPQDLCGINEVPSLIEAGVDCFKVEGRLKTPEYVATAARSFGEAIIKSQKGQALTDTEIVNLKKQMASTYSRGFFSGWLHGVNHQKLVEGTFSAHRGFEFAKIVKVGKNAFEVELNEGVLSQGLDSSFINPGDGLLWVFVDHKGRALEKGGFVFGVKKLSSSRLELEFSRDISMHEGFVGARVYYNHDKDLKRNVALSIEDRQRKKRCPVSVRVKASLNEKLLVEYTDDKYVVSGESENVCELAKNKGVSAQDIQDELFALSGSPFVGNDFFIELDSTTPLFIPHRQIKELRQNLVAKLIELRTLQLEKEVTLKSSIETNQWVEEQKFKANPDLQLQSTSSFQSQPQTQIQTKIKTKTQLKLNLVLREKGQVADLIEALSSGKISYGGLTDAEILNAIILDFEFGRDFGPSVEMLRSKGFKVGLATTRILKPNEHVNIKHLLSLNPDFILARNVGAIEYLQSHNYAGKILGDFSLNVTNHLTSKYLLQKGLESLCISYDLNHTQVTEL
ncbi:MAG: peptidase U32 family protein, partial [Pseudobdellovibrionaceae bacterium]